MTIAPEMMPPPPPPPSPSTKKRRRNQRQRQPQEQQQDQQQQYQRMEDDILMNWPYDDNLDSETTRWNHRKRQEMKANEIDDGNNDEEIIPYPSWTIIMNLFDGENVDEALFQSYYYFDDINRINDHKRSDYPIFFDYTHNHALSSSSSSSIHHSRSVAPLDEIPPFPPPRPPPPSSSPWSSSSNSWLSVAGVAAVSRFLAGDAETSSTTLSLTQQRALAIIPKVTSAISMPCSCFIIYEVIQDWRENRATAVKRALLGMSVIDILASSGWFLSTWAVPASSGFAYAKGNMASCNYQGFLLQLAVGAPLYNSSLALFYLLMIKNRWTTAQFDKSKIEWYVHGFILSFAIGTSILLLLLGQYNHIQAVCWVIGSPPGCGNSSYQPNPDVPCDRGDYAWVWGLALFYGPLWICVIGCTTSMFILYKEVRKTHQRSRRYSVAIQGHVHSTNRSGQDTARVATQAILYSLSFLITWMPSTLWSVAHWFGWEAYGLDLFAASAEPLQGFWNFLIFLMGRPNTRRKIRRAFSSILPCICKPSPTDDEINYSQSGSNIRSSRQNAFPSRSGRSLGNRLSIESVLRNHNRSHVSSDFDEFGSSIHHTNSTSLQLEDGSNGTALHGTGSSHGEPVKEGVAPASAESNGNGQQGSSPLKFSSSTMNTTEESTVPSVASTLQCACESDDGPRSDGSRSVHASQAVKDALEAATALADIVCDEEDITDNQPH